MRSVSHIAGQVRNDGSVPAKFVQIIATFYAADGTVVGTGSTFSSLDTIQPGQVSPYELISQPPKPYSTYRLQVQAENS
ncbi:MAG TPA: FxLYD domain-containing protein [Dehalococcoidia bacterium]